MSLPLPRPCLAFLWVALGAIPGVLLRWFLANTMLANTLGCFVVGVGGLLDAPPPRRLLLLGVGFAGSLTTFSTWMLQLVQVLLMGDWWTFFSQILRDGALGLGALLLGAALHRRGAQQRKGWLRR